MKEETTSDISKSIADLASITLKMSMEQMDSKLEAKKKEIHDELDSYYQKSIKLWSSKPVMSISLDDLKTTKKLSKRASAVLPRLLINARLGLYSMLVGPAGCGKTTAAHQVAEALGLQFGSVCLTAGASETWLFGRQTPTGFIEGSFAKIYREGGVFLADEMDAADANLLLSINTALSHDKIINPMSGETLKKNPDFIFIGAANTNGKGASHIYTGRSRLDAATLDRMVIVLVDYDTELEKELCDNDELYTALNFIRADLKKLGYDEFISTRAFLATSAQLAAGVTKEEVLKSLTANWGDASKDIANKNFLKHFKSGVEEKKKEKVKFRDYVVKMQGISTDEFF